MKQLDNIVGKASDIAREPLKRTSEGGSFITGDAHFNETLWTRDFCYAALGMLTEGMFLETECSIEEILKYQKRDGQLPKLVGHTYYFLAHLEFMRKRLDPEKRVGKYKQGIGDFFKKAKDVFDPNPLVAIVSGEYAMSYESGKEFLLRKTEGEGNYDRLKSGVEWSLRQDTNNDYLMEETGFATWADSIIKNGNVLYSNVLLAAALDGMAGIAESLGAAHDQEKYSEGSERVKRAINEKLWLPEKGYYADWLEDGELQDHFTMDGNALAVVFGIASKEQGDSIQDFVKSSGITEPVPSKCMASEPDKKRIVTAYFLGGIPDYHINKAWLWLGCADAVAKIRLGMYDGAKEEIERMARTIHLYNGVYEIYGADGRPFRAQWGLIPSENKGPFPYKSEPGFRWSAGMFLYAVSEYNKAIKQTNALSS